MKILLSAYACEPNRGSEPEVGWNWALELANLGHQVWVITRSNNRKPIEEELSKTLPDSNLHFIYFDLPDWACRWKKGIKGVHLYYLLWQLGAYGVARQHHHLHQFDQVYHVTFVSVRQPSFMGCLGVPFVFGPVAGGERAPYALRKSFPLSGWLNDFLRDVANVLILFDPLMHLTFMTARHIYVTSEDTRRVLPWCYRHKASVHLAIGLSEAKTVPLSTRKTVGLNILFVGNLLYLKGIHLALRALPVLLAHAPDVHFTIIGNGPDKAWLKKLSALLQIETHVTWIDQLPRQSLLEQYALYDLLLFPSLHDSGGMVVLEALSRGLLTVCLDIGGPGQIVTSECGSCISVKNADEEDIVASIAACLAGFYDLPSSKREKMAMAATQRAAEFLWPTVVSKLFLTE